MMDSVLNFIEDFLCDVQSGEFFTHKKAKEKERQERLEFARNQPPIFETPYEISKMCGYGPRGVCGPDAIISPTAIDSDAGKESAFEKELHLPELHAIIKHE